MSAPLMPADPAADAARRIRLRRMRALALSLLVVAAIVFLFTVNRDGFWGYVNAGAEASMVGAMADWFAVTALFRHPLGLPIPHTALIPRRKDEFGKSLEDFVTENFLAQEVVRERLRDADVARRLGQWVTEPENAARVVSEVATVVTLGLRRVRPEDVESVVSDVLLPRLVQEPIAPVLGNLLRGVLEDDAHHAFVDLVVEEGHRWLVHNQETFTEVLGERAPWWSPPSLNERVTQRLHVEAIRWIADIRNDPHHHARKALDSLLDQLATDLLQDPDTMSRAERLKARMLETPELLTAGMAVWEALRRALIEALEDPQGVVRARAEGEVIRLGRRLVDDEGFRTRIDNWGSDLAVFFIERYGSELTSVITSTIRRWDGRVASDKIELHVGPDLQFIRINGTIVGGLVGLVIHAVAQVVA